MPGGVRWLCCLVLALCLSVIDAKSVKAVGGNSTAEEEVTLTSRRLVTLALQGATKLLGHAGSESLSSVLGKKRSSAFLRAVGPGRIERLNKLKMEELKADAIDAAVAKRGDEIRKQALDMIKGLRIMQQAAAVDGVKMDGDVGADGQMQSKDSDEACLEHPLGCLTLGILTTASY